MSVGKGKKTGNFKPRCGLALDRADRQKIGCKFVNSASLNLMFIGPCIIVIVEESETNLMSLVIFITLDICSTCFEH